jgi:hypothetical protein
MPTNYRTTKPRLVICVNNEDYPASLEQRKIYQALPDRKAAIHGLIRVIDESGEDYLYPADWFVPVTLPRTTVKALALATSRPPAG